MKKLGASLINLFVRAWRWLPGGAERKKRFKDRVVDLSTCAVLPLISLIKRVSPKRPVNHKIETLVFNALVENQASIRFTEKVNSPFIGQPPVKLVAFYLPQFHSIPENDAWWGKGFTEWTNVRPATPQFGSHYQPHVPGELGYYELNDSTVFRKQIDLAKLYGLHGFCFYFYWFGGKTLLEMPLSNFLSDRSLDFPFCLCWANESWSRTWAGLDTDVLIAQRHSPSDDLAFIRHVARYMTDSRYIRINGKPLLLVYRPSLLPSALETSQRWRSWCAENGIGEIYLAYTQSFDLGDPKIFGFDAAVEFPPNNCNPPDITTSIDQLAVNFSGKIYDWRYFVAQSFNYKNPGHMLFRGVCPSWDNSARRGSRSTIFENSSPRGYQQWLTNAISDSRARIKSPDERLVFVNAWNEWAEGAHLEPDERYGYAYLEATRKALLSESNKRVIVVSHDAHPHGAQFLALGMVRSLKVDLHLEVEVVLLGEGRLKEDFSRLAVVHDLGPRSFSNGDIERITRSFVNRGFSRAIVNTTVSGRIVPIFAELGIDCICLIHELPGIIRDHGLDQRALDIANFAKAVVFPAHVVAEGFSQFATVDPNKIVIRPQGLYRRNKWRLNKSNARTELRSLLGLSNDVRIVLAVGYADHRKGVDLFVDCALNVSSRRSDVDFVWVGHWDERIKREVDSRLHHFGSGRRVHFVGYTPDTSLYHAGADVYALTSREDPFPNVVLESFDAGVPVVAFRNTGGASLLVSEMGGPVVEQYDIEAFSASICSLLDNPLDLKRLGLEAQSLVESRFGFRAYLFDLCLLLEISLPKISVIVPNFNYSNYIETRLTSIRNQSVPIYEIIILDDASSDNSVEIISNWLASTQTDAKVVVNAKNSENVFRQWFKGISIATGDYVWIAEADDFCDADFLETVLPAMTSREVVLSYCESKQIDSRARTVGKNYHKYVSFATSATVKVPYIKAGMDEITNSLAIMNVIPNVSAVLFRRKAIDEVFDEFFSEIVTFEKAGDWVVYFRTLMRGSIAYIPHTANHHRRHRDGVIASSSMRKLILEIEGVQALIAANAVLTPDIQARAKEYIVWLRSRFGLVD